MKKNKYEIELVITNIFLYSCEEVAAVWLNDSCKLLYCLWLLLLLLCRVVMLLCITVDWTTRRGRESSLVGTNYAIPPTINSARSYNGRLSELVGRGQHLTYLISVLIKGKRIFQDKQTDKYKVAFKIETGLKVSIVNAVTIYSYKGYRVIRIDLKRSRRAIQPMGRN